MGWPTGAGQCATVQSFGRNRWKMRQALPPTIRTTENIRSVQQYSIIREYSNNSFQPYWSDVGLWVAACFQAKISVHIYNHVCTIDTVTGNLAVNSVFITFRSMRETKKFHFFHFSKLFLYKITVSFTMVIKRSPGGESAGDGRLRNPPVQFRRDLWLHLAIDQYPVCPNLAPVWTLTSEMVPFGSKSLTLSM